MTGHASSNRVRDEAVRLVDARHGYTAEFAPDPEAHRAEYDTAEEALTRALRDDAIPNRVQPESDSQYCRRGIGCACLWPECSCSVPPHATRNRVPYPEGYELTPSEVRDLSERLEVTLNVLEDYFNDILHRLDKLEGKS